MQVSFSTETLAGTPVGTYVKDIAIETIVEAVRQASSARIEPWTSLGNVTLVPGTLNISLVTGNPMRRLVECNTLADHDPQFELYDSGRLLRWRYSKEKDGCQNGERRLS